MAASENTDQYSNITVTCQVIRVDENGSRETEVEVCREETVSLYVNDNLLVCLSISPTELEAFAAGHLLCEGWITHISEITRMKITGTRIDCMIPSFDESQFSCRRELLSSGYPGKTQGWRELAIPADDRIIVDQEVVFSTAKQVNDLAQVWIKTGGTHCTVIASLNGDLIGYAEDMGRHTSVDKAVGKAALQGADLKTCIIACSGRMPADMVAKCCRASVRVIISHNAPFTEGINLAKRLNLTLAGFVRPPRMTIYTGAERIRLKKGDRNQISS